MKYFSARLIPKHHFTELPRIGQNELPAVLKPQSNKGRLTRKVVRTYQINLPSTSSGEFNFKPPEEGKRAYVNVFWVKVNRGKEFDYATGIELAL